ncbi:MAG: hypothetical protein M0P17_05475 [Methanoculleus sp.]|nr:hypothetical protein [Methanoculleus sp.]
MLIPLIPVPFKDTHVCFVREGTLLGGVWLLINRALDAGVLLPFSGMDAGTYMARIGLRYLTIPIIAVGIGYAAAQAVRGAMVRKNRSVSTEGLRVGVTPGPRPSGADLPEEVCPDDGHEHGTADHDGEADERVDLGPPREAVADPLDAVSQELASVSDRSQSGRLSMEKSAPEIQKIVRKPETAGLPSGAKKGIIPAGALLFSPPGAR